MAKRKIPSPSQFLKDLFSKPPAVSQDHIEELERRRAEFVRVVEAHQQRLDLLMIDLEVVKSEIEEMLLMGCSVEPGPLTVALAKDGKLVVSKVPEDPDMEEEEIPF